MYHENSKLNELKIRHLFLDKTLFEETKEWYLKTVCKPKEEDIDRTNSDELFKEVNTFPEHILELLRELLGQGGRDLLYSVDLLFLYNNRVYRLIPDSDYLMLEKICADIIPFTSALLDSDKEVLSKAIGYLVIVGVPWRRMVFEGSRGYKTMLMEGGVMLNIILNEAKRNFLSIKPYYHFFDNQINRFLNLDGVESYAIVVAAIFEQEVNP